MNGLGWVFPGNMQLETTNFGQIAHLHSICAQCHLSVQILPHLPKLPQPSQIMKNWNIGEVWKGPICAKIGVHIEDGGGDFPSSHSPPPLPLPLLFPSPHGSPFPPDDVRSTR